MPKPKFPNVHKVYLGHQESLPKFPKAVKKQIFFSFGGKRRGSLISPVSLRGKKISLLVSQVHYSATTVFHDEQYKEKLEDNCNEYI